MQPFGALINSGFKMIFPFGIKDINELYRNSESGNGGFSPLGKGVFWHSGIHINSSKKEIFLPILTRTSPLNMLLKSFIYLPQA